MPGLRLRMTSHAPNAWASGADDVARPGVRPAWGPRIVVGQDAEGGVALKQGAARCTDRVLRHHRFSRLTRSTPPRRPGIQTCAKGVRYPLRGEPDALRGCGRNLLRGHSSRDIWRVPGAMCTRRPGARGSVRASLSPGRMDIFTRQPG